MPDVWSPLGAAQSPVERTLVHRVGRQEVLRLHREKDLIVHISTKMTDQHAPEGNTDYTTGAPPNDTVGITQYRQYRRTQIAEMADWEPSLDMTGVSISKPDLEAGSPKLGDKIARNPANHEDRWLVSADYFAANFEPLGRDNCG